MSFNSLAKEVEKLKKSKTSKLIKKRINEFEKMQRVSNEKLFSELCFCLLTANFNAEKAIKIQKEIGKGFLNLSEKQLSSKLKQLGHRFPNARAKYIVKARKVKSKLKQVLSSFENGKQAREYFVREIKGLGFKEASHFLRNIGFDDVAIIDFHIIDVLSKHGLIKKPKTLNKKKYLEIEEVLEKLS